jgi:hypothetical protein
MTSPSPELLKKQIQKLLGREVGIEALRNGRFLCKYVEYGVSNLSLVGETETEALQKLLAYLQDKKKNDSDPEPPLAA